MTTRLAQLACLLFCVDFWAAVLKLSLWLRYHL